MASTFEAVFWEQASLMFKASFSVLFLAALLGGMVWTSALFYGLEWGSAGTPRLLTEGIPVFTGVVLAGRLSSSIALHLAKIRYVAARPRSWGVLLIPRVLAGGVMLPLLMIVFVGLLGLSGYITGRYFLSMDPAIYTNQIKELFFQTGMIRGLAKASIFGVILSVVGCFEGCFSQGEGPKAQEQASYRAAVISVGGIVLFEYTLIVLKS